MVTQKSSKIACCIAKADNPDTSQISYRDILHAFIHDCIKQLIQ